MAAKTDLEQPDIDPTRFRRTLGAFPTGVVVVSGHDHRGPHGLAVGSFTSVSLRPPLVGFLVDRNSSSWPKIAATGTFCVNVLASDQLQICRKFAASGGDKFADIRWHGGRSGSPILHHVLAWIDCDIDSIHEAGDHSLVLGRVRELEVAREEAEPLLFFRGVYGRFQTM